MTFRPQENMQHRPIKLHLNLHVSTAFITPWFFL
uniref:Uncharacterized protein n=1 Tax=Rhizophora mucronata TaxID=61149 RepID=A0A2P2PJ96_RHIMU